MEILQVTPQPPEERRRGTFRAHLPLSVYQPDGDKDTAKYGNYWEGTFADREIIHAVRDFLSNPENNWASLIPWITEKLRANIHMTRKELMKWMGCTGSGDNKKKITRVTFLTKALNQMIERGKIAKGKNFQNEEGFILIPS